jgi:hypothetical protein
MSLLFCLLRIGPLESSIEGASAVVNKVWVKLKRVNKGACRGVLSRH